MKKDVLLLKSDSDQDAQWVESLAEIILEVEVRVWPHIGNPDDICFPLLWRPPAELFENLQKLEVIFFIGAGVERLIDCPAVLTSAPF